MWRKSSFTDSGNCVEVRRDLAALRDSKQPDGPRLPAKGLPAFIASVKTGRFDR
jgi:Domain of unknown function (DUF397)